MATSKSEPAAPDTAPEPSEARKAFEAGEIGWNDYVKAENEAKAAKDKSG